MRLTPHRPDFVILFVTLLLVSIGLLNVYSASIIWAYQHLGYPASFFFERQIIWGLAGFVMMFVVTAIPFWFWKRMAKPMLFISILMLPIVFAFPAIGGAKRWIDLGPVSFQPSEAVIFSVIVYVSFLLTKKQQLMGQFSKGILPTLIIAGIPALLILVQPDMGTATLLLASVFGILVAAGTPWRFIGSIAGVAVATATLFIWTSDYRYRRIMAFLDPWQHQDKDAFQLINSLYAISNGGWMGRGLGQSIEKFLYLPEPHTDFIFSILAEEWGTIGGYLVIFLFAILVWRGGLISMRIPDRFGSLLASGIVTMIGFAVIVNIGMVTGMMPVIGIPLPFISYGGTSLVIKMISMGVLLNLSRYTVEKASVPSGRQTTSNI